MHHLVKQRPYLILELMIALAVVALSIAPLTRLPAAHLRAQIRTLEKMELAREGEFVFAKLKANLYKADPPWGNILHKAPKWTLLDPTFVDLAPPKEFFTSYKMFFANHEKIEDKTHIPWRLLQINISFKRKVGKKKERSSFYSMTHTLAIHKTPSS